MTPDEALRLCRIAKSVSPAQAVDDYTPDAWALILRDVRLDDAEDALRQLGGEQEWIHVSHIVKRVKRIRSARVDKYLANVPVPSGLDAAEYDRWYRATVKSIADGDYEPEPPAALDGPKRDIRELAAGADNSEAVNLLRSQLRDRHDRKTTAPSKPTDPEHARRKAAAKAELDAIRHKDTNPTPAEQGAGEQREAS